MSDLSNTEKTRIEHLLGMEKGFVLTFSDRTFKTFIIEHLGVDIYEEKYSNRGTSKANRLRSFWDQEPNYVVGKLLVALLEYWKTQKLINALKTKNSSEELFNECFKIAERLIGRLENIDQTDQVVAVSAHFEEIQKQIIDQIENARFTIWVAVAWFTDGEIFEKLITKRDQGINVQLVIIDDEINTDSGLKYDTELETYKIPKLGEYQNLMHNKFCVIDLKTVIHGSYNWTKKAQFNRESITVLHDRRNAEKFAEEFVKLKLIATS